MEETKRFQIFHISLDYLGGTPANTVDLTPALGTPDQPALDIRFEIYIMSKYE